MSNRKANIYISADELRDIAMEILKKEGVNEGDAFVTADCLVKANLRGIDTHGVIRLKVYVDRLRAGGNNPTPNIRVIHEGATTAVMTNVLAGMPPTGGRQARIGNNPFAIAFPADEEPTIVFDAATSLSSWGKVFLAAQTGALLPEGCFLDKEGKKAPNTQRVCEKSIDQKFVRPVNGNDW